MAIQFFIWLSIILYVLAELVDLLEIGSSQFQNFAELFRGIMLLSLLISISLRKDINKEVKVTPSLKKWALILGVFFLLILLGKLYKQFLM